MSNYWKEVDAVAKSAPTRTGADMLVPTNKALLRRAKAPSEVLWALAGLSLFDVYAAYIGAPIRLMGLILPELIFEVGRQISPTLTIPALIVALLLIGAVVGLGFATRKLRSWAFIAALSLFSLDILVSILVQSGRVKAGIVHLVVISVLVVGLKSTRMYQQRQRDGLVEAV